MIDPMNALSIIPNSLCVWGLGQMGVALQGPDAVLYIDPCLSNVAEEEAGAFWYRGYPPPVLPQQVTNADYLLITHEHLDHLDPQTVPGILAASPQATVVTSGWCQAELHKLGVPDERILVVKALEPTALPGTSARLTAIPSAHYDLEYDDEKGYRWLGFLVEWNGVTFYHAGDTIIYPQYRDFLRRFPTPDVAMVPVNGRDWYRETEAGAVGNLLPVEMATLAKELGWRVVIPGHNDLYPNNAIPFAEIAAALERVNPRQRWHILQPGEPFYIVNPA